MLIFQEIVSRTTKHDKFDDEIFFSKKGCLQRASHCQQIKGSLTDLIIKQIMWDSSDIEEQKYGILMSHLVFRCYVLICEAWFITSPNKKIVTYLCCDCLLGPPRHLAKTWPGPQGVCLHLIWNFIFSPFLTFKKLKAILPMTIYLIHRNTQKQYWNILQTNFN